MYHKRDFELTKPERRNYIDGSPVFFTADTHFSDRNAFLMSQRPFASLEEMNEALIDNWNSVVPEDGVVFHLGDFGCGGKAGWEKTAGALHGRIYLILGNHDYTHIRASYSKYFEEVLPQKYVRIGGQPIYLNHYPFLCYEYEHLNTWQLFGHVHSGNGHGTGMDIPRLGMLMPRQYDVGVDNNNFTPVSFEQVRDIIGRQIAAGSALPLDGNGQRRSD